MPIQNLQTPLLNGVRTDASSTLLSLDGLYYKFPSINYEDGLEPGEVRGNQTQVMAYTRGIYKATGSFELYKSESDNFNFNLINNHLGTAFYEIQFQIVLQYKAETNSTSISVVSMPGVRINKMTNSSSQGSEAHKVKYDLTVPIIVRDGVFPTSDYSIGVGGAGGGFSF